MKILQTGDYFLGIQNMGKKEASPYLFSQIHDYKRYISCITKYAKSNQVDVVLIMGNLFFSSLPGDYLQSIILEQIKELSESNIDTVVLKGKYDQPTQDYSFLTLLQSLPYKTTHIVQKDECVVLKKNQEIVQIIAIPYQNSFAAETTDEFSHSEIGKKRIAKLLPKIEPGSFSLLLMQASLSFLEPFFLVPDLPVFNPKYLKTLPFQYFAFSGQPFKKVEKISNNTISWVGYAGSLGEFEYADSTIERGFLVMDTQQPSNPPQFIHNSKQRPTALIRVYVNSEKEAIEKLNEEFLLNDYREHITRIVLHTDANLSLSKIHKHFEDHCFHIHSIEQQGKRLCYVGDEEILPVRKYIDIFFEEKRLSFPEDLEEKIENNCLSYINKEFST
jgi:DNA repair exonuclease SbcCD nuclease subunit